MSSVTVCHWAVLIATCFPSGLVRKMIGTLISYGCARYARLFFRPPPSAGIAPANVCAGCRWLIGREAVEQTTGDLWLARLTVPRMQIVGQLLSHERTDRALLC